MTENPELTKEQQAEWREDADPHDVDQHRHLTDTYEGCNACRVLTLLDALDKAEAAIARATALVNQWNDTPDYTPTDYDQGRVDQRHDMTMQLLDALADHEADT